MKLLVATKRDASTTHRFVTPGVSVSQRYADEPFVAAVRSQERLCRALRRIGVVTGPGALRLYADVDPLGAPIVVIGPVRSAIADRVSLALEVGPLRVPEGDPSCL